MGIFLFPLVSLSLSLFFFHTLFDVFLGSCQCWWHSQWIWHWQGALWSRFWEKSTIKERRKWSPHGKVSKKMACISATMVGLAMARKPWASHAWAHHHSLTESLANFASIFAYVAFLTLTYLLTFIGFLVLFLTKVTILRLVQCPFHVVYAPVLCFLTYLLLFWFAVLG